MGYLSNYLIWRTPKLFRGIRFKLSLFVFLLLIFTTILFSLATVKILNQTILNEIIKREEILRRADGNVIKKNTDGTIVREIPLSSSKFFEISTPIVFKNKT